MTKHTPEPWSDSRCENLGKNQPIAITDKLSTKTVAVVHGHNVVETEANASRIVACVNACEGINPEAVKDLLEACYQMQTVDRLNIPEWNRAMKLVGAAIAKAEKGK